MDDVAARAGVSRALVSLVMRGSPKVSEQRRTAVLDAADALGYRPNVAARNLAQRRSHTIGVVINDLHNTFFADVVDGVHEQASAAGYRLLLNAAWKVDGGEEAALENFLEHRVDALMVLGPRSDPGVLRDAAKHVPIVSVGLAVADVDSVVNDDERGGELVAEHLLGLGHTRLAHIDGGLGAGAESRRRGFVAAVLAAGLEPMVIPGEFDEAGGAMAAEQVLGQEQLPTALFAANDLAAIAAIDRLNDAGVRVPKDISVVGYDNTYVSGLQSIGLTTVDQPREEMGRVAVRCLLERLEEGRRAPVAHVVNPRLVPRSTSATPPRRRPGGAPSASPST